MNLFGKSNGFNEAEFKQSFVQYRRQIYNFLYFRCGDGALADDLCQNTFLALWENRRNVQPDTVLSYLYKIAQNLFLNEIKHKKVVQNFSLAAEKTELSSESPEFLLEETEFRAKLENIIASIPEKSRTVFLMNRIENLTYAEIAIRLEISIKAVEKRMKTALEILREFSLSI